MPSNHQQVSVYVTADEIKKVARAARGLTLGNYFRKLAGLKTLKRGRPKVKGEK